MKKLLFTFFGLFILFPMLTFASGKMIIGMNETIILGAQSDLSSPEYKWSLLRGDTIIHSYTGKQFTYLFQVTGNYKVNLVVSSNVTDETENSFVEILVGASEGFADSLDISLQTLPRASANNTVSLSKKSLNLSYILSKSKGDVSEYRIDADTQKDSDNDGDPANDIDNLEDESYGNGKIWTYEYLEDELPTTAKITLIDSTQAKEEITLNIQVAATDLKNQKLKAVFESFPQSSEDKRVHLYEDEQEVFLFGGNSFGDILEYRIDTDIQSDSDGDGKPNNDIDNLNHQSFKTGENFPFNIKRVHGDKIMQLTIVSSSGKGSLIQKKFIWDTDPRLLQTQEFRLFSEADEVYVGEALHFGIEGVIPNTGYEIKWDFNGDQEADSISDLPNVSYVYEAVGDYEVLAQIKHEAKQILKYGRIPVRVIEKPESPFAPVPQSNFEFDIQDNKVVFSNNSLADESLEDKTLSSEWKFGDGTSSSEETPEHIYQKKNNYVVRLVVTDANGQIAEKSSLVEIQNIDENLIAEALRTPEEPDSSSENTVTDTLPDEPQSDDAIEEPLEEAVVTEEGEEPKEKKSFSFLSLLFWILVVLVFGVSGLLIIYIIIQKIKHPDYSFGEIIEEEKEKILSALEGREYEPPHGEIVEAGKGVREAATEILEDSNDADSVRQNLDSKQDDEKMLEPEDAIVSKDAAAEPEAVSAGSPISEEPKESIEKSENNNDSVPDWMKDDHSEEVPSAEASPAAASVEPEKKTDLNTGVDASTPPVDAPIDTPKDSEKSEDDDIPDWLK